MGRGLIVQSLSVENVSNRYTPDKSTKFGMGVPYNLVI